MEDKEEIGFQWAKEHTLLFKSDFVTVTALSPLDSTVTLAFHEIANSISADHSHRRAVTQTANDAAIVLWVECGEYRALLGADLERGRSDRTGWRGILTSDRRPMAKAHFFKIPHHGSDYADEPRVWNEMLVDDPISLLTSFSAGRKPRPAAEDIERLKTRTTQLAMAGRTQGSKASLSPDGGTCYQKYYARSSRTYEQDGTDQSSGARRRRDSYRDVRTSVSALKETVSHDVRGPLFAFEPPYSYSLQVKQYHSTRPFQTVTSGLFLHLARSWPFIARHVNAAAALGRARIVPA